MVRRLVTLFAYLASIADGECDFELRMRSSGIIARKFAALIFSCHKVFDQMNVRLHFHMPMDELDFSVIVLPICLRNKT